MARQLTNLQLWEEADDAGDSATIDQMSSELRHNMRSGDIPVDFLWSLLSSKRIYVRECATWLASELGKYGLPLVPICINSLSDPAPEMRFFASEAVGALGALAIDAAFVDIVRLLLDEDSEVRHSAVAVLIKADENVLRHHVTHQRKEWPDPRSGAVQICLGLATASNPSLDKLEAYLSNPERAVRLGALVGAIRLGAYALPVVKAALRNDDKDVRYETASFAHRLGKCVVPCLIERIQRDSDVNVRGRALYSLARLRQLDLKNERGVILSQLRDRNAIVRQSALQAIKHIFPLDADEIGYVLECIRDSDENVRSRAGITLSSAAKESPASIDGKIEYLLSLVMDHSLDSDVCHVRTDILHALGECSRELMTAAVSRRDEEIRSLLAEKNEHIVFGVLYVLARCTRLPKPLLAKIWEIEATSSSPDVKRMTKKVLKIHAIA